MLSGESLTKRNKNTSPNTLPWRTPDVIINIGGTNYHHSLIVKTVVQIFFKKEKSDCFLPERQKRHRKLKFDANELGPVIEWS